MLPVKHLLAQCMAQNNSVNTQKVSCKGSEIKKEDGLKITGHCEEKTGTLSKILAIKCVSTENSSQSSIAH